VEKVAKEVNPLQQLLHKLGGRGAIVQATLARLKKAEVKASISLIYKTIAGSASRPDIEAAFLAEAEAEITRRREVTERARQLVAEA
jgi:hypothetical protein